MFWQGTSFPYCLFSSGSEQNNSTEKGWPGKRKLHHRTVWKTMPLKGSCLLSVLSKKSFNRIALRSCVLCLFPKEELKYLDNHQCVFMKKNGVQIKASMVKLCNEYRLEWKRLNLINQREALISKATESQLSRNQSSMQICDHLFHKEPKLTGCCER